MITRLLAVFVLFTSVLAPAAGQFAKFPSSKPQRVTASLVTYEGDLVAGSDAMLGVVLEVQEGWKIQAGRGSGDEKPPYLPTEIEINLPEGWQAAVVRWPAAQQFEMVLGDFREELAGYNGRFVAVIPITVPADAPLGEVELSAVVTYQACDATQCEMQESTTARAKATVVASAAEAAGASYDEVIAGLFEETLSRSQTADPTSTASPASAAAERSGSTFFNFSVPRLDGFLGLVVLAFFAALGGFILNLTPCVLPVIPIKIMTLQQHAGHPGRNLTLGLWMFAGVVAFWVGIGLPAAFITELADPSRLFGIWYVTFGIGAIIALMGIGIMGLFAIQLPQSVYSINPRADTAWGSFAFGVMTAVLGLPCFGFVAGALLAGATTLPPTTIMIVFTFLGIGMGMPYMVLSAKPSLVEKIPRTGPASELVKQVMGLLLLAAAAYFIGSGLIGLVSEQPYLARQLHWWAVALLATVASLWLVIRTFQITPRIGPRVTFAIVALVVGGFAVAYAAKSTVMARENHLSGYWATYTPDAFERARAEGKVVVLDFTAEWCINCKALKAAVLDVDPVRGEMAKSDTVNFTVDLTSRKAEGWALLQELGQTGIPLLVIYTPGQDQPWQANSYTSHQVLTALEHARNGSAVLAQN